MHTIPDVLTPDEVARVRSALGEGVWVDGAATASGTAAGRKHNLQLQRTGGEATELDHLIVEALGRNDLFRSAALPRRFVPPIYSRYLEGMGYGRHVDAPLLGAGQALRTDASVTLFLSDPDSYEGGALVVETPAGEVEVKLPAGAAVLYSGSTYHRVESVTRGERLAAVTWVQSFIRDPALREVLFELEIALSHLNAEDAGSEVATRVGRCHANLMRMFSEG